MMEPAGNTPAMPRAFLRVGGRTLARHQLDLALAMECQRIVCIARSIAPELIALQHEAESAGTQFHVISETRALAGLITANDELLVFADGLLVAPREAMKLLEGSHAVLVQPVETGMPGGFERIDLNYATAGLMRIPGRLADRLAELPADCNIPSSLTRIALQAGIQQREVPVAAREGARWRLIGDEAEAQAIEKDWIRLHLGEAQAPSFVTALAQLGVLAFGPSLLHARSGSALALRSAAAALLLGAGAGWLGSAVVGFLLCAFAAILLQAAGMLRKVESGSLVPVATGFSLEELLRWLIDLELILLVLWSAPFLPWETLTQRAFAPVILILLLRLVPRVSDRRWTAWTVDRALLALLLALAAGLGVAIGAVKLVALALALTAIAIPGGRSRIT